MNTVKALFMLVALLLFTSAVAQADIITIDGDNADWSDPDNVNDDPNESTADGYDVDLNYFEWDVDSDHVCFYFQTYDVMPPDSVDDYARILINADENSGTGGAVNTVPGMEYYLEWALGASDTPEFYAFNGGWSQVTPTYLEVERGDIDDPVGGGDDYTIVEWALGAYDIGRPGRFLWGAYLDNGGEDPDDYCPDDADQPGRTPEPTTLILFPIGLAALGAWRRRKAA